MNPLVSDAKDALDRRDHDAAQSLMRRLCDDEPAPGHWMDLAQRAVVVGFPDLAAACYGRVIDVYPNHGAALLGFAVASVLIGRKEQARRALKHIDAASLELPMRRELGWCFWKLQDLEMAEAILLAVTREDPRDARSFHILGNTLRARGRMDSAVEAFGRALSIEPSGLRYYDFVRAGGARSRPKVLGELSTYLRTADGQDAAHAHFAAAAVHGSKGNDNDSFSSLEAANQLQRASSLITIEQFIQEADYLSQLTMPEGLVGSESETPVFLIALPRSGSSLSEQILATHSQIQGIGEQPWLSQSIVENGGFDQLSGIEATAARKIADAYLSRLEPGFVRVVDKMPDNAYLLRFIERLLPRARILLQRRHPMDIVLSIYSQSFEVNRAFYCDIGEAALFVQHYLATIRRWRATTGMATHDLFYERLVVDSESEIRSLIDFCDVPWEAECLRFHDHGKAVFTASDWQVRQPLYSNAMFRWKRFEERMKPAAKVLADEIQEYEEYIRRFGLLDV